jgi:hypothetical protein
MDMVLYVYIVIAYQWPSGKLNGGLKRRSEGAGVKGVLCGDVNGTGLT